MLMYTWLYMKGECPCVTFDLFGLNLVFRISVRQRSGDTDTEQEEEEEGEGEEEEGEGEEGGFKGEMLISH